MDIKETIIDFAIEAGKAKLMEKIDERKIKCALSDFIESQRKYNDICSLAEEIDFQGLINYIKSSLLDDAVNRFFSTNKTIRRNARNTIIKKAIDYSTAKNESSKEQVAKFTSICLDIIHDFYISHSANGFITAATIIDSVYEDSEKLIQSAENKIISKIDESRNLLSVEKANSLSKAGKLGEIADGINQLLNISSTSHPLFPDYGFDFSQRKIRSIPLTDAATQKYPPKYVLSANVRVGEKSFSSGSNLLDYSYRHQMPIILEVSEATKLLGDVKDPQQDEAKELVGKTLVANPPVFPSARPCKISVGSQTFFDYVLLRIHEVLDDGTIVINNREQDISFYFELHSNPSSPENTNFSIAMNHPNNHELLQYVKFMQAIDNVKYMVIHDLSSDKDLFSGCINSLGYKSGFPSIEEEIDFIERVCCIEDYFGTTLKPEGDIYFQEIEAVKLLSNLIRENEVRSTWKDCKLTGTIDEGFRLSIQNMIEGATSFSYVGISQVELFGAKIKVPFYRTYLSARIVDFERVKEKLKLLDDGDSITIRLQPRDNNISLDTLKIPNLNQST